MALVPRSRESKIISGIAKAMILLFSFLLHPRQFFFFHAFDLHPDHKPVGIHLDIPGHRS